MLWQQSNTTQTIEKYYVTYLKYVRLINHCKLVFIVILLLNISGYVSSTSLTETFLNIIYEGVKFNTRPKRASVRWSICYLAWRKRFPCANQNIEKRTEACKGWVWMEIMGTSLRRLGKKHYYRKHGKV